MVRQLIKRTFACLSLLICASSYAQQSFTVDVFTDRTDNNSSVQHTEVVVGQPMRFSQFMFQQLPSQLNWQQASVNLAWSRFGNQALQSALENERQRVAQQLAQLERLWQQTGHVEFSQAAAKMRQQVMQWPLFAAYQLALEPDRMRLSLQSNVLLSNAEAPYQLWFAKGAVQPQQFGIDPRSIAADNDYRWRIAANGDVARQPVALYNRSEAAQCHAHQPLMPMMLGEAVRCQLSNSAAPAYHEFVPFKQKALPQAYENINQAIVGLIKFYVPDTYANVKTR